VSATVQVTVSQESTAAININVIIKHMTNPSGRDSSKISNTSNRTVAVVTVKAAVTAVVVFPKISTM
jgi:hypothetical protein